MTLTMITIHWTPDIAHTRNTGTEDFIDTSFSVRLAVGLELNTIRMDTNDLWMNGLLLVESDKLEVEYRLFSENSCSSEKCRSIVLESDLHELITITQLITMQLQLCAFQQQRDYLYGVTRIVFLRLDEVMQYMWFVPCECMLRKGVKNELFPPIVPRLSPSASIT